ncbi:MAG TPA: serine/threonine-protein kinase [Polyangia bacterium]|nr:serine/threonine-protein kinase [Polyangia bacterium]
MKTCAQCQISYPDALEFCPRDGASLPVPPGRTRNFQALYDALIGTTVDGRYLIEAKLGEGGMGVVYAARHAIIDKRVAMKVLKAEAQDDPTAGPRFIQEAKSASKVRHLNIVDITDFGMLVDGSAYFVMEFLDGHTLGQALRKGPLAPARVIHIASQIARGLQAAHQNGVIHRDLKPDNIFLLSRDGISDFVKIVDFGIALLEERGAPASSGPRLTQVGMVLGTPEYMAPERATGKESDHRVDQYALGCIMYEMLTGDVPYRADDSSSTLHKHVFDPIVPLHKKRPDLRIPLVLDALVVRAMAKNPTDRFSGMKELLEALERVAMEIPAEPEAGKEGAGRTSARASTITTPTDALENFERSKPPLLRIILGTAAIVLVIGGMAAFAMLRVSSVPAAPASPSPQREAAVRAVATTPVPPPAPPTPSTVQATLRSAPEGAEIYRDGTLVGHAPLLTSLPSRNTPVEFLFRLKGFQERPAKIVANQLGADRVVTITLSPLEGGRSSSSSRGRKTESRPAAGGTKKSRYIPKSNLQDPFGGR